MLLLEGQCPKCYGNLILSEGSYSVTCEDCGTTDTAKTPNDLVGLLIHCGIKGHVRGSSKELWLMLKNLAKEYGPVEKRHKLTLAGKSLLIAFNQVTIPVEAECEEIDDALEASRGLLDDKEKLKHLIKEGFVMAEE